MLVVRSHMARFSSYVTDTMFAPHMSEFTKAEVPDVLKEIDNHESWLSMFLLNSVLRSRYTEKTYQFAYNFLRRSEGVCREYELARKQTAIFLEGSRTLRSHSLRVQIRAPWMTLPGPVITRHRQQR